MASVIGSSHPKLLIALQSLAGAQNIHLTHGCLAMSHGTDRTLCLACIPRPTQATQAWPLPTHCALLRRSDMCKCHGKPSARRQKLRPRMCPVRKQAQKKFLDGCSDVISCLSDQSERRGVEPIIGCVRGVIDRVVVRGDRIKGALPIFHPACPAASEVRSDSRRLPALPDRSPPCR